MPQPAAFVTSMHTCPMTTGPVPHVGGPVVSPSMPTVMIGAMPAIGPGSVAVCVGPPDAVAQGSPTVMAGSMPLSRMGDSTSHGGVIVLGNPMVLVA
jgi:uncharacterized Zn-binding protein involved in type VI secretion